MSTCERCRFHDCQCCEHAKPPGQCVECAHDENNALCQRVIALEADRDELRLRVEVLERKISALARGGVP